MSTERISDELKSAVLDLIDLQHDTRTPAGELAQALPAKRETIGILERRLQAAMEAEAQDVQRAAAMKRTTLLKQAEEASAAAAALTGDARAALAHTWGTSLLNAMDGSGRQFAPLAAAEKQAEADALRGQAAELEPDATRPRPVQRAGSYPTPLSRELIAGLSTRQFASASASIVAATLAGQVIR